MKIKLIIIIYCILILNEPSFCQQTYNDPIYPDQYYHKLIMANYLNNFQINGKTRDDREIVIAVVENAIKVGSEDINWYKNTNEIPDNNIDDDANGYVDDHDGWNAFDENDNFNTTGEGPKHGENVAGIIAAKANNSLGMVGVAPNFKILPIQGGGGSEKQGLEYVIAMRELYNSTNGAKGAFIVACNLSYEWNNPGNPSKCSLINELYNCGVLLVTGAGNNHETLTSNNCTTWLTCCENSFSKFISVGGSNAFDCRAVFSPTSKMNSSRDNDYENATKGTNQGTAFVHVVAPAEEIKSFNSTGDGSIENGTSFAAPQVGGLIALIYAVMCETDVKKAISEPAVILSKVRLLVLNNCIMPNYGHLNWVTNYGRINVYKTLLSTLYATNITDNILLLNQTLDKAKYVAKKKIELINCSLLNQEILLISGEEIIINPETSTLALSGSHSITYDVNPSSAECTIGTPTLAAELYGTRWSVCVSDAFRFYKVIPIGGLGPYHFDWRIVNASGTILEEFGEDGEDDVDHGNFEIANTGNIFMECVITDANNTQISKRTSIGCTNQGGEPEEDHLIMNQVSFDKLEITPNPTEGKVAILFCVTTKNSKYWLYNLNGSKIGEGHFESQNTLDLTYFPTGIYFLTIKNDNAFYNFKIIRI